jgi:sarcosine oxidase subunit beta
VAYFGPWGWIGHIVSTARLRTGSTLYDCVVIGGGVIGSSIAYHAAKGGASVALVEPGAPRSPSASWASAGGLRRQNRAQSEWALALTASRRWLQLEEELQADCEFRAGGHLHLALDESTFAAFQTRAAKETAAGLDVQLLDSRAVNEIAGETGVTAAGATFTRGDGQANPRLTTRAFLRAAARLGATVHRGSVLDFKHDSRRVTGVILDSEELGARTVVLAGGSWSPELARRLGIELPVTIAGLQMLRTDSIKVVQVTPTIGVEGVRISFKQLPSGAFLIGGGWPATVERAAHKCFVRGESVRESWAEARGLFPVLHNRSVTRSWCGLETMSHDGVPFIGRVPYVTGLYVAVAFSGHGFQLAPAVGQAVADELAERPATELAALGATRMVNFPEYKPGAFSA